MYDCMKIPSLKASPGRHQTTLTMENSADTTRHGAVGPTEGYNPLQVTVTGTQQEGQHEDAGIKDCTWTEVLSSMQDASSEYREKSETNKLRAAQRDKAMAMTLLSLTDMIPEQDGLSFLRGGMSTIFKLLNKRIDNGERILTAFEDIPFTFSEACIALRAHRNDAALHAHVEDLYQTLRQQIPILVDILLRKHKGSLARRILKQHPEVEAKAIENGLTLITRASHRVTARVGTLSREVGAETLRETKHISADVSKTHEGVTRLLDDLDSMRLSLAEAERGQSDKYERQERLIHGFVETINKVFQQQQDDCRSHCPSSCSQIQGLLQGLINSTQSGPSPLMGYAALPAALPTTLSPALPAMHQHQPPSPWNNSLMNMSSAIYMSYDELYVLLNIADPMAPGADLNHVMKGAYTQDRTALGRAAWLLNVDRFKAWADITGHSSDLVLVNGHLSGRTRGKISPLSVLAATLASMPPVASRVVILSHFCGLHISPRDPMAGPRGMLRSLVAQLLLVQRSEHAGTTVTLDEALIHRVLRHDLAGLCDVFRALLMQVQAQTTVYCVLDSVSEFETSLLGWGDDMCDVVYFLQTLVMAGQHQYQPRFGPKLKFLLTAANKSIRVYRQLNSTDCISLSAGNISSHSVQKLSLQRDCQRAISPGRTSPRMAPPE